MRKFFILICSFAMVFSLTACNYEEEYERGYEEGYEEGYYEAERESERKLEDLRDEYASDMEDIFYSMIDPEDFANEIRAGEWSYNDFVNYYEDIFSRVRSVYRQVS